MSSTSCTTFVGPNRLDTEPGPIMASQSVRADANLPPYRLIDTAQGYGNEESVGQALRDSGVPRREVFLPPPSSGQGPSSKRGGVMTRLPR